MGTAWMPFSHGCSALPLGVGKVLISHNAEQMQFMKDILQFIGLPISPRTFACLRSFPPANCASQDTDVLALSYFWLLLFWDCSFSLVHVHICTYFCTWIYVYGYAYVFGHVCIYVPILNKHIYICIYVCIHTHTHRWMFIPWGGKITENYTDSKTAPTRNREGRDGLLIFHPYWLLHPRQRYGSKGKTPPFWGEEEFCLSNGLTGKYLNCALLCCFLNLKGSPRGLQEFGRRLTAIPSSDDRVIPHSLFHLLHFSRLLRETK